MQGKIQALRGADGKHVYPTSVAEAIYIGGTKTLSQRLREIDYHITSLVIDLKRWGIKEGLPTKPYTAANYNTARRNIIGLNNAIKHAHEMGYQFLILPKGEYSLCYPFQINMKSNLTLNLGGSTLKVMYDSVQRSPFDTRSADEETYTFGGISFMMKGIRHAHIMNGKLIGDAYEREFAPDSGEEWYEHSYGVSIQGGSAFCTLAHMEIRGYMGDNINVVAGGVIRSTFNNELMKQGRVDEITGVVTEDATQTTVITDAIQIPSFEGDRVLALSGQGYYRLTNLNNKYYDVYFYDADDKFLGVLKDRKVQQPFPFPDKATKYRFKFYNQNADSDVAIFLDYGANCHHNTFEYNTIADGHRGGMTMGGSYNVVQFNEFTRNGKYSQAFLDGIPPFPDPTRYQINQEDSYGDNCVIQNNHFSDSWHGLLIGVYSTHVKDNVFNNIDYGAIILYNIEYGSISGNYLDGCDIVYMTTELRRALDISGNFVRGRLELWDASGDTVISNNTIIGYANTGNAKFEHNTLELVANPDDTAISIKRMRNCIVRGGVYGTQSRIRWDVLGSERHVNNEYADLDVQFNFYADTNTQEFSGCEFSNCAIATNSDDRLKFLFFTDCKFNRNTYLYPQAINGTAPNYASIHIENSDIKTGSNFVTLATNMARGVRLRIMNSRIKIVEAPTHFIASAYNVNNAVDCEIYDNEIRYEGVELPVGMKWFQDETRANNNSFIANNRFITTKFIADPTDKARIAIYNRRDSFAGLVTGVKIPADSPAYTFEVKHNFGTKLMSVLVTDEKNGVLDGLQINLGDGNTLQIYHTTITKLNIYLKKL